MDEWVAIIHFSDEVDLKLREKHGITPDQVREAVALGADDEQRWDDDENYGRRLMLWGTDAEGEMLVFLRDVDRTDGVWECLTAWRM